MNKIKQYIKNNKLLFILLIINLCVLLYLILPVTQVSGPLYGGDYYFFMGHTIHIYEGGSLFQSSHDLLSNEAYPWFFHALTAGLAKLTFQNIYSFALHIMPILAGLAAFIVSYLFFKEIFKNKIFALCLGQLWFVTQITLFYTASRFANVIMVPLIGFIILNYFKNKKKYKLIWVALIIGIAGLTHLHLFTFAVGFFILMILNDIFIEKNKIKKIEILNYILTVLIGAAIGMIFLYIPIFIYHGQILNSWQTYAMDAMNLKLFFKTVYSGLGATIFKKIMAVIGIILFFLMQKKNKKIFAPVIYLALIGLLGVFHPIITNPLMGMEFAWYKYGIFLRLSTFMFGAIVIYYLYKLAIDTLKKVKLRKIIIFSAIIIYAILIILLILTPRINNSRWMQLAYSEQGKDFAKNMYEQVDKKTDINEVFISDHGESLFALNAATGRKVIFMRRTHFTPFMNVEKRIADTAIILYGNNDTLRKELIEYYKIKYYYVDSYSVENKKNCMAIWDSLDLIQNQENSYSCLRSSPEYEEYLNKNGVETKRIYARKDVSRVDAEKFDLLTIKPSEEIKIKLSQVSDKTDLGGFNMYNVINN